MGKNKDLIQILALVIIGMFIPFLGSIAITFSLDLTNFDNWLKIGSTFGYFLLIFAVELGIVFLYFIVTSRMANKKIQKNKPR
jgi:hypothetical protein